MPTDIQFRLLTSEEYPRLIGLLDRDDWIPIPDFSKIVIGEQDGEIVAFWVMQFQAHLEPVWIKEDLRKSLTIAEKLLLSMKALLSHLGVENFYSFSDNPQTSRYLERLGFNKEPFEVWRGGV